MTYISGGRIRLNDFETITWGPDVTLPSAPTNVTATAISSSQINLSWLPATDDRGVSQYQIYRDNSLLTTIEGATSYTDLGVIGETTYSYYVIALDGADNASSPSNSTSATTLAVDITPNPFTFTSTTDVALNTEIISETVTITGLTPLASVNLSATGGTIDAGTTTLSGLYEVSKTITTSASGTLVVSAKMISSSINNQQTSMTINVGTVSGTWSVTTAASSFTPAPFTFNERTGVALNAPVESNSVTITGLPPVTQIVINAVGGTIDAGTTVLGGTFAASKTVTTSASGTIVVAAKMTSGSSNSQQTNMSVTIGTVTSTWSTFTASSSTSFVNQTGVPTNAPITSNLVTVSGLTPNFSVTVTASNGMIDAGASSLSGTFSTSKTVTASDTGTIVVAAQITSNASTNQQSSMTITVGAVPSTWTVYTSVVDLTPTTFNFTDQTDVALNSTITSNTVTVTGMSPNTAVTVSGTGGTVDAGTNSLSGIFAASKTVTTSASGTIVVSARIISSAVNNQQASMTITVGTVSDLWTVTTQLASASFNFIDKTDVPTNSLIVSDPIVVNGLMPNTSIIVSSSGGTIDAGTSVLSGTFATSKTVTVSASGTIVLAARMLSSNSYNQQTLMTITVGSVSDSWYVTTSATDITPDTFTFVNQSDVAVSSPITSTTITVTGLAPLTPITVSATGGTIDAGTSVLSGVFENNKSVTTSETGTLVLAARMTSSSANNQQSTMTVTVGSSSSTWTITTAAGIDTTPNAFDFIDQTGVSLNSQITSDTITVSGLTPNVPITVSATGGTIDAGTNALSGTFASSKTVTTSSTGTLVVAARLTSGNTNNQPSSMTITVGTVSDTWNVTTVAADIAPNAFNFTDQVGVAVNSPITSNTLTISGLSPNAPITVSATGGTIDAGTNALSGTFASSKTVTTSSTGTLVVAARITSSATNNQPSSMTITVGTVSDTWNVTTVASDIIPNTFNFTDQTNVATNSLITSDTVIITGLSPNAAITVSAIGGTIDAGTATLSGTFDTSKTVTTSATGTLVVAARMTSSNNNGQQTNMTITVGSLSDTWSVTTVSSGVDITPDVFNFTDQTSVALNTPITSNTLTITGLAPNTVVSVTGTGGTVDAGTTTLSGTFNSSKQVTTSATGTLVVAARMTSSVSTSQQTNMTITVGTVSDVWTITTTSSGVDLTPNAFDFTDQIDVSLNSTITSNTLTITGLAPTTAVTISGTNGLIDAGTNSLSGTFAASKSIVTSSSGTLVVAAQMTSGSSAGQQTSMTITVGTVSDVWTVTTTTVDITPDAFNFTDQTNVALNTDIISDTVVITGLAANSLIVVSATNGLVDAGSTTLSGTFAQVKTITTSATGSIVVAAKVTSSAVTGDTTSMTITVGTVSDTWSVTTQGVDVTPNAFTFADQTGVALNTNIIATTTVTGFSPDTMITVSCTGGTIDAGTETLSGTFAASKSVMSSTNGTIVVAARMTSSGTMGQPSSMIITIGSVSDTWTITTLVSDVTPDPFNFDDLTNVPVGVMATSTKTITGMTPNAMVTVSANGGEVDAGAYTLSGTYDTNKTVSTSATGSLIVTARMTSSSSYSQLKSMTVTIGSGSDTWNVTTMALDSTPATFDFIDRTNVDINTEVTSNTVTVSGLSPNASITVSATGGTIDAGTSSLSGTFAASKSVTTSATGTLVVAARMTTGAVNGVTNSMTITVGTLSDTWNVLTVMTPNVFNFVDMTDVDASTIVVSDPVTVSGMLPNSLVTVSATNGMVDAGANSLPGSFASTVTLLTSATGTIMVAARLTSSSIYNTQTSMTITVGSRSDVWNVTTKVADITPDDFTFTDQTGVPLNSTVGATLTVTGMSSNAPVTVTCTGGLIDAGDYALSGTYSTSKSIMTSTFGSIVVGAQQVAGSTTNQTTSMSITVGTKTTVWSVTTVTT